MPELLAKLEIERPILWHAPLTLERAWMCEEASLRDPEIVALCNQIVNSQQEEIA